MNQPVKAAHLTLPAARKNRKQNIGYWRKYGAFYVMITPALVFLLINNYLPMVGSVIAFKNDLA
ncbi:hypothetical protein D3C76_197550 [compost metagenome]